MVVLLYPSLSSIMEAVENRYILCMLVAKRARQLAEGAPKLTSCKSDKPVTIATHEINERKISYLMPNKKE